MSAQNEQVALKTISEKFLFGDLQKIIIAELKALPLPWSTLPEKARRRWTEGGSGSA